MSDATTSADAGSGLPDPWRCGPGDARNRLLQLAAAADAGPLAAAVRDLLGQRADEEIRRALELAPTREAYRRLWEALCAASAGAAGPADGVIASIFALPLVIVSGARHSAWLPGMLADPGALMDVLQVHGALGASRNVGFSNALCSLETLMQLPPSTIHGWSDPSSAAEWARAIVPEPIAVRAGEEVHLRFLLGAAITPAAAPAVAETAAHIGAWGMPFTRALAAQIGAAGVELLALPRPPCGVLKAAYAGRSAQLEVALNLFMSNTIKRTRAAAGEPALVISVHEAGAAGAELRVSVSSALDDTLLEGFRWPLHPLDDPNEIARNIRQLAADCRLTDISLVEAVLPEGGNESPSFVRAGDVPAARKWLACLLLASALASAPAPGRAAHPFVTDDTGTQGAGNWQLEVLGQHDRHDRVADPGGGPVRQRSRATSLNPVLTYGLLENLDLAVGLNHLRYRVSENGLATEQASGASDSTVELKWRFYENNGFSLALKPGLQLPTGDENRGLGTGRTSWGAAFIATYEAQPWTWLGNIAYFRPRFALPQDAADNRGHHWRVSGGASYALSAAVKLVGELGVRTNPARSDPFLPGRNGQFATLGAIYSPTAKIDLDVGVRKGLSHAETDLTLLIGATFRW